MFMGREKYVKVHATRPHGGLAELRLMRKEDHLRVAIWCDGRYLTREIYRLRVDGFKSILQCQNFDLAESFHVVANDPRNKELYLDGNHVASVRWSDLLSGFRSAWGCGPTEWPFDL